ncbi:MAG: phosphoglucosamine mutase [Gemmataceae bacterium]|nr:phosphoglucosamine mutase [Gemmataceae bacterium]MDW8265783.1 phosphoglucosamine mutase [Gemmataceae bacterium]
MTAEETLIVSVSGIRGIVGRGLTAERAAAFASALATTVRGGRVVLSRDGRPSGVMLRHAVLAALLEGGCEVHDLGIAPTPTCGLAVRRLAAQGGVQLTASHNPAPWNGLKLFNAEGTALTDEHGRPIRELFQSRAFRRADWNQLGRVIEQSAALGWHRDRILELIDVKAIGARRFGVVLDANGGAGGRLGPAVLEALNCRSVVLGGNCDGTFAHEPEPIAEHLTAVTPLVPHHGADVGFVLDPDADRLALIDEIGRYIGEELTLALAVDFRLRQEPGPVVINMSTSRLVEDIARRYGCPCYRSAVGEANVVEKMRAVGAVIGGEGNGGVIDPRVGGVRDPFIGMGLVLNLLAWSGRSLSQLVAELPTYHIVKAKWAVPLERWPALLAALEKRWSDAAVNRQDGLRLDWPDRWLHVRLSNTEPVVRLVAEAPREEDARRLCEEVGQLL